jgi:hypothetical protein
MAGSAHRPKKPESIDGCISRMRSLQLQKSPTPDFDEKCGKSPDISKGISQSGMCKFESSKVSQAVRHWEKLSPILAERPANGGLLRIGHQSPGSVFYHLGGENPESLPTRAGLFPFSGDCDRRLVRSPLRGRPAVDLSRPYLH